MYSTMCSKHMGKSLALIKSKMKEPIFKEYASKVAELYGVSHDELFSKTKTRAVVDARHLLYYVCKNRPMKLKYIQDYMGRNGYAIGHSSIVHGIEQVEKRIKEDVDYQNVIENFNA